MARSKKRNRKSSGRREALLAASSTITKRTTKSVKKVTTAAPKKSNRRVCDTCGKEKPSHLAFHLSSTTCKKCTTLKNGGKPKRKKTVMSKSTRAAVLKRDGHKCIVCGKTEGLTLHHKVALCLAPSLGNDANNLVTLCTKHHNEVHTGANSHAALAKAANRIRREAKLNLK